MNPKLLFSVIALFIVSLCSAADNITLYADEGNHTWVDLGLPSGTKWATTNVGAAAPEDCGDYYAWGETTTKSSYSWSTYKYANGASYTLTKYCNDASYGNNGFTDNKMVLDAADDVAHVLWGGAWRMPTAAEWEELIDYCDWTWTTQNGANGYLITSRTNGLSIFLPAAGYRNDTGLSDVGYYSDYWSSSLYEDSPDAAQFVTFNADFVFNVYASRLSGYSVRPVWQPSSALTFTLTIYADGCETPTVIHCDAGQQVNVSAVAPDVQHSFVRWSDGNTDNPRLVTVIKDMTLTAVFDGEYTWVDLGLPSGLKWATCNVGAIAPEEYGNYYAWGETTTKDDYSWATYRYANGTTDNDPKLTKYCNDASYGNNGFTDSKTVLDPDDNIAHIRWGSDWRMPTNTEWDELRENCDWTWTTQNGVNGYRITGRTNGNSIFLPAAGRCNGTAFETVGDDGHYWSSALYEGCSNQAWCIDFGQDYTSWGSHIRISGYSVRPVSPSPPATSETYTLTLYADGCETPTVIHCDAGQQVNVSAVAPDAQHPFVRWSDGNTDNPRLVTVLEYITLNAVFEGDHARVDLGLPSGTKWATMNVGASAPEEYGDYYAWGETTTKDDYSFETYQYANGAYNTLTKYCNNASYGNNGFTDNKTVLDAADDVAHIKWGGDWRMPTAAEWKELMDNCDWTWTTQNGMKGRLVTSRTNGNSIFLPAAGYRNDTGLNDTGSNGRYWSSSLGESVSSVAWGEKFDSENVSGIINFRYYGYSVRPVWQSSPALGETYTLTLYADGCETPTVIHCDAGQQVNVSAVAPDAQHPFVRWSDGNTDNPRLVTVTEDMPLTAVFAAIATAIDQTTVAPAAQKIIRNGIVYILRGGHLYTAQGQQVVLE